MRKKALSVLLALGMVISLLPGRALAQEEAEPFEETQVEAELVKEAPDEAEPQADAELSEDATDDAETLAETEAEPQDEAETSDDAETQADEETSDDAEALVEEDAEPSEEAQAEAELSEEARTDAETLEAGFEETPEEAELFDAGGPVSLRVVPPTATTVTQGTALDIRGLEVYAVYGDGTEKAVMDYALSGMSSSDLGPTTVTVTYAGLTETFSVTVVAPPEEDYIAGFFISPKPNRYYTQGEPLDITGMKITVIYHSGKPEVVDGSQCAVTGYNPNQLGIQTVTVSYKEKHSEYLVQVSPPKGQPVPDNIPSLISPRIVIESVKGGKKVSFTRNTNDDHTFEAKYPGQRAKIYYTLDGSAPVPGAAGTFEYNSNSLDIEESVTIKAVAIWGEDVSAVVSGRVSVPQVEAPMPANPHHRNNQGPNGGMTELALGTLVSFLCDTAGASIYYWFERQAASAEDSRYGSSVYVDGAYADDDGEVVLYAYAAKDGYRNSDRIKLKYRVPKEEKPAAELVNVSAGTVSGTAGAPTSASLSITTEESSYVTGFSVTIRYDRRNFRFDSVSPADTGEAGIAASDLFAAPDPAQGLVRIMYSGAAVSGGEMCMLNFSALASAEDASYSLTVDPEAKVSTSSGRPVEEHTYDGAITLGGSDNSQLTAAVLFSAEDSREVGSVGELSDSSSVTASISLDQESVQTYTDALTRENDGAPPLTVTANAFIAFYGEDGLMLSLETWEIDLSNLQLLIFERMMEMPDDAVEIQTMVLSESLTPIMASSRL